MKVIFKIVRILLVTVIVGALCLPSICYVMLSTRWAQQSVKEATEEALHKLFGTNLTIGDIDFRPFNRLDIMNVVIQDDMGMDAISVDTISTRIELLDLIGSRKFIVDYAVLQGLSCNLYKVAPDSALNIDGIISRLKKEEKDEEKKDFLMRLNSVEISRSHFSYNVLSDSLTPGRFNPSHICMDSIEIVVFAPLISPDDYDVRLRRLHCYEQSGLEIKNLEFEGHLKPDSIRIENFNLSLPKSRLMLLDTYASLEDLKSIVSLGTEIPIHTGVKSGSHVYLPDLSSFVPDLKHFHNDITLELDLQGKLNDFSLERLLISDMRGTMNLDLDAHVKNLPLLSEAFAKVKFNLSFDPSSLNNAWLNNKMRIKIDSIKNVNLSGELEGSLEKGLMTLSSFSKQGELTVDCQYAKLPKGYTTDIAIDLNELNIGSILQNKQLGEVSGSIDANLCFLNRDVMGELQAAFDQFGFKGYDYKDIEINAKTDNETISFLLDVADPLVGMNLRAASKRVNQSLQDLRMVCNIEHAYLDSVGLYSKYPGYGLSAKVSAQANGLEMNNFSACLNIDDLKFIDDMSNGVQLNHFSLEADNTGDLDEINMTSEIINGNVEGEIDFSDIGSLMKNIFYEVFPTLSDYITDDYDNSIDLVDGEARWMSDNEFVFDFTISKAKEWMDFYHLPVAIIDPVNIVGEVSASRKLASIAIDAPYLLQGGNKMIDNTVLTAILDGVSKKANVFATTHMPTKKGPMNLILSANGADGQILTNIDWQIERQIPINGNIDFSAFISRQLGNRFLASVEFQPGQINFGDEVWNILPSEITFIDDVITVNDFGLKAPLQSVKIDGRIGESLEDVVRISLQNINLIEIFETLEIDKALLCGLASGEIIGKQLLSKTPILQSETFNVKNMGYNRCVLGDADIKIDFDNEKQAFLFDASLINSFDEVSTIRGSLTPAKEELDLRFDAHRIKVGFLQPFMEAFCSAIDGYATGKAHLFGTFKYIDLEADVEADSLSLKIDFTNTWYHTDARVKIDPGRINLNDIAIYDEYGHKAILNGELRHFFFHDPEFEFNVTQARNFLCYDVSKTDNSIWYGRIFGNGSVDVTGYPGVVNIAANITTAQNTVFTFELSDAEEAEEYSFLTFRDVSPRGKEETNVKISETFTLVESMKEEKKEEFPTAYNLDFQVEINPLAQIVIVMDPVGGDRIRSYGNGKMQMYYGSIDDDLQLRGLYTLERGDYNFTLQDIIIKEFKIKSGSSIRFDGNPYNAALDITATYSVNANLSDLDDSFLTDKELNRTNVPVNALLKVTGEMKQPEISFDLEFPTLSQDVYRKVKSIVSTDDMMNRQIIYLMALHRFYTPDYMESTTKGNELFSVASSTISSQLSSMLGKLSENWSIAPNLRSDRGDFSDVEVDVALSSSLLNNRLLFNGNFGYRDKSLNTNQFVGDFDIEYLLNRPGTIRLKAYNRYNDQNYYLRQAQTTQGVGIMYRKDFDGIRDFLRKKPQPAPEPLLIDSIGIKVIETLDSLAL